MKSYIRIARAPSMAFLLLVASGAMVSVPALAQSSRCGTCAPCPSPPCTGSCAKVGDLDNDGTVDRDDLALLTSSFNTPASGPNDVRDINGDGRIDARDARYLALCCTNPGCAS